VIHRFAPFAVRAVGSILLLTASALAGKVIHVPADQPAIQAAINAAANGDTVLVAPGTYNEQINFLGKTIVVRSQGGNKVTTIDGASVAGPVVRFVSGETLKSVLQGFTIQNGTMCCFPMRAAELKFRIHRRRSSPTISGTMLAQETEEGSTFTSDRLW
jgi:hypothetical protein